MAAENRSAWICSRGTPDRGEARGTTRRPWAAARRCDVRPLVQGGDFGGDQVDGVADRTRPLFVGMHTSVSARKSGMTAASSAISAWANTRCAG